MNIKTVRAWAGALLLVAAMPAFPVDDVAGNAELMARYPSGSIDSTEKADQALLEVAAQRKVIEQQFATEQAACHQKFFMNACLDAAKERHRVATKQVRAIEIEANGFKRKARVVERDRAMEERAAQEEKERPVRLQQQEENEAAAAQRAAARAGRKPVEDRVVPDTRAAQHEERMRALQTREATETEKRDQKVAEYEQKVKKAQEHQREVAARKQERERKRAQKGLPPASASGQ